MAARTKTLPDDPVELKKIIARLQNQVDYLNEQFRLAQHKRFAASTEVAPGQEDLFNEAEQEADLDSLAPEEPKETQDTSCGKKKPKRKPLPKDLPREEIIHDISEADKVCACCQSEMHAIGDERSERLEYTPASFKVIENIRLKYSCRQCEKNNTQVNLQIAPVPASPIPKSIATPSLLSQIIVQKYQYALPLYRQEAVFRQCGVEINRKTMANWIIACSVLLDPVIKGLKSHLLAQPVIHADESPLKVIQDDKQKSYMWCYCTGTDSPNKKPENDKNDTKNIVLYDYQPSRAGECAVDYLQGYNKYLLVDGYAAYEQTEATLVGCMAHARRKFIEAQRGQVKGKTGKADWAINHIKKLYRVESQFKDRPIDKRYRARQIESKVLLEQFKTWLDKSSIQVPPKSLIGIAIHYSLNQWEKLARYIDDGHLSIDNNRAERAIKPFVIGRKNWMFSTSAKGAKASANLYSLVETAKANGIEPYEYINRLLTDIPSRQCKDDLSDLMPWNL